MKNKDVASALIGTLFFTVPYVALSFPILPSLGVGVLAFTAGELVFNKDSKDLFDVSSGNFKKTMDKAKRQNSHIKNMIKNIEDKEIKENLKEINETIDSIIKTVSENPHKVKKINNFFTYYLPLTIKIIDRYDEVENKKLSSRDSKKFMKSTNEMVIEINYAFKKILNKLYESDIVDTDAEMKVLNSLLKSDGFDSSELKIEKEGKNG